MGWSSASSNKGAGVVLSISKQRGLIVDFRRRNTDHKSIYKDMECVKMVPSFKFIDLQLLFPIDCQC